MLGSLLVSPEKFTIISAVLEADDFLEERHKRIFARMRDLSERNETIDRFTLSNELMKQGQLESVGGASYIVELDNGLPVIPNIDSYIRIVKEKSTRRRIIFSAQKVINRCLDAGEESGEIAAELEAEASALSRRSITAVPDLTLSDTIERVGLKNILEVPAGVVAPPWKSLAKEMNGGARPGEVWVIAARPSVGKSTVALQLALNAAAHGQRGIMFTLEMTEKAMLQRAISCQGRISKNYFGHDVAEAPTSVRYSIHKALNEIAQFPLSIRGDCRTVRQIIAAMAHEPKPDFVAIDYLGLVESGKQKENRNQELSYISRKLKLAALDHGVAVFCAAQLSRANETENRPPQMSDLRDSGSIEQDADVVLLLDAPWFRTKKDKEGNDIDKNLVKLIISKQREGARGGWLDLTLEGEYCRLTDPKQEDPDMEAQKLIF